MAALPTQEWGYGDSPGSCRELGAGRTSQLSTVTLWRVIRP